MSWLGRLFRSDRANEARTLLRLRVTRLRRLLATHAALLALLEDAAEKQEGEFIFDRQYVVSLSERVAELADAAAFDLNVLTSQKNLAFYEAVERLRAKLRAILEGKEPAPGAPGEEIEYRLLRAVREAAFPLTVGDGPVSSLEACATARDLVHLADRLAGDEVCRLLTAPDRPDALSLASAPGWEIQLVDLEALPARPAEAAPLRSRPLDAFLKGLAAQPGKAVGVLHAAATGERSLLVSRSSGSLGLVDATLGQGTEADGIFCRFSPGSGLEAPKGWGELVAGVLSRLDFVVSRTREDVNGFLRERPSREVEERLRLLGCLFTRLADSGEAVEPDVEAFLRGCA